MSDLTFHILGAEKSTPDYRDHKDATLAMAGAVPSASKTDLSQIPVAEFSQEKIGICTSSLVSYIEWLYWKKTGTYTKLSRRFLYSIGKNLIDGNILEGSSLRTMLKAAYNYGVCTDDMFPSAVNGMTHEQYIDINAVPAAAWAEARKFQIGGYVNIPANTASMQAALAKYGLLYSMKLVGAEWWTAPDGTVTWDAAKINPIRPPVQYISGHAMIYNEYDGNLFGFLNDWGLPWCKQDFANFYSDTYPTIETWALTLDRLTNDLPPASEFKYTFTKNLTRGSRGDEVLKLQIALMILGYLDYVQIVDRGYYGALTQEAVKRFLIAMKISPTYLGLYWGPKGRQVMNSIFS